MVRDATQDDLDVVVSIHLASFKGFFLSSLGPRFLRLLYLRMMEGNDGELLVYDDGGVQGFVGGVLHQSGFYRRLVQRHKWQFGMSCLGAMIRRPWVVARLLRALRRPAEASRSAAEACLMSIGVLPSAEGRGVGRSLVAAFCERVCARGQPAVCLTTDKINNDRVNRFYSGMGFTIAREYTTPEGREMYEYVKQLA